MLLNLIKTHKMDLMNKKFTINLTTLIGIVSVISTIIGGYWYFKTTIETTRDDIKSANENYKELKNQIHFLREMLYEMAITYNKNIQIENEIHESSYKRREQFLKYEKDTMISPLLRPRIVSVQNNSIIDTIDILKMKVKPNIKFKIKN